MIGAVPFIAIATYRTEARGIPGVNEHDRNSGSPRLVVDLEAQVMKRPTMQGSSLGPSSPNPATDARKVFEGNAAPGAFGLSYHLLADAVVYVFCEARFSTSAFLEQPPRRLSAFLLQLLAQTAMAVMGVIDMTARVHVSVRIHGDVHNAQVNAEKSIGIVLRRLFNVARGVKVKLAIAQNQVRLALLRLEKFALPIATNIGDLLSATDCPDRDQRTLISVPSQDPLVIGDSGKGAKLMLSCPVKLVSISYAGNAADNYLGRQVRELLTRFMVSQSVQGILAETLALPSLIAQVITSRVGLADCFRKCCGLLFGRLEFDLRNQFHGYHYNMLAHICQE